MDTLGRKRSKGSPQDFTRRLETGELLQRVADKLFLPKSTVQIVYECLVETITESLLSKEKVVLRRLGVLIGKTVGYGIHTSYGAKFKSSNELKDALKRKFLVRSMDKYGVSLNKEAELIAKITGTCPECKEELTQKDPPVCPSCGTKPFEKKAEAPRPFGRGAPKPTDNEEDK